MKLKTFIIAILMLASPATAQQPGASANAEMSESGKKIFQDSMARRNADLAPLLQQKRQLDQRFSALLTPATYDNEKLRLVMMQMREVEGRIVDIMGSSMLALLGDLSAEDRAVLMRSISRAPPAISGPTSPAGPNP